MRSPKDFFRPLALGAPEPLREIPVRPSRMIHFFDPSNPKMAENVPSIAARVDISLGNLEDAIAIDNKEAAREGFIEIANKTEFGDTQLWTRVNSLDSPWFLDDLTEIVTRAGDKLHRNVLYRGDADSARRPRRRPAPTDLRCRPSS